MNIGHRCCSRSLESLVFPGICLVNLMSLQTFLSFALKFPFVQTFPPAKFDTRVTFAIFLSFPRRPALPWKTKKYFTLYRKRSDGHKRLFSKGKQRSLSSQTWGHGTFRLLVWCLVLGTNFPQFKFPCKKYELGKAFVCWRELSDFLHRGAPTTECTCVSNKRVRFESKVGPPHHFEKQSAKAPWASDKWKEMRTEEVDERKVAEAKISFCLLAFVHPKIKT